MLGVLADGSGGGSARQELEQLEGRATSVINWVNATGGYFGILGLQAGVWLSLEKAKLKKLIAATIAIATMEAPGDVGDFSGVIGDVVCDAIKGVAGEALGSIGTNTASALVRALAGTGQGILQADGFVEAGTGSAAINC